MRNKQFKKNISSTSFKSSDKLLELLAIERFSSSRDVQRVQAMQISINNMNKNKDMTIPPFYRTIIPKTALWSGSQKMIRKILAVRLENSRYINITLKSKVFCIAGRIYIFRKESNPQAKCLKLIIMNVMRRIQQKVTQPWFSWVQANL